jgi:hypothetical protein
MKYIFIIFFAMFWVKPYASGQSAENTLHSFIPAKWEIGIDLLPLIKMNHLPQNTLFFRRNYAINDRTCKAFRFRVGLDAENTYATAHNGKPPIADNKVYSPYLALGNEWKFLHGKYRWYVGAEISGQITHANLFFIIPTVPSSPTYDNQKIRNQYITGGGIFGLQYAIGNKLFISVESSVDVKYTHERLDTVGKNANGVLSSVGGEDRTVITSKVIPIFSFSLNYSLQKQYNYDKK